MYEKEKEELKKLVDSFETEAEKLGYHVLVFAQSEKHIVAFRTENCPERSVLPVMERFISDIFEKSKNNQ